MPSEKRIEQVVQVTAVVLLALGCLVVLMPFLGAVIGAGILCFSTWPIYSYVERKVGATATEAELIAHCRGLLAHFKAPKSVVCGELPKTSTGKIQKFVLRERAKSASAIE